MTDVQRIQIAHKLTIGVIYILNRGGSRYNLLDSVEAIRFVLVGSEAFLLKNLEGLCRQIPEGVGVMLREALGVV